MLHSKVYKLLHANQVLECIKKGRDTKSFYLLYKKRWG